LSEGYPYLSMIGWIDRRAQTRRIEAAQVLIKQPP
jgi:hypothetical protein